MPVPKAEQLDSFTTEISTSKRRRFNFVNVEGEVLRDITKECINTAGASLPRIEKLNKR